MKKKITDADNWADVACMIREAQAENEQGTPAEEPEKPSKPTTGKPPAAAVVPKLKSIYKYKPKGSTRVSECEVTAIDKAKKTVTLTSNDTNKVYKDVPWSELKASLSRRSGASLGLDKPSGMDDFRKDRFLVTLLSRMPGLPPDYGVGDDKEPQVQTLASWVFTLGMGPPTLGSHFP